jgi:hypothetical protein
MPLFPIACHTLSMNATNVGRTMQKFWSPVMIFLPAGKPALIPLTGSLFVPATLASVDKVLVDVGTGYYVEVCHYSLFCFYSRLSPSFSCF